MAKINKDTPTFLFKSYGLENGRWPLERLSDYVFFQEGPGLRNWQWKNEGMKVINITNIIGAGIVDTTNTDRYISMSEFYKTYSHFEVQDGDIVIASSGWSYGKVGRIKSINLPLMMNTSVIRFRSLNTDKLDNDFLFYFLSSKYMKRQIDALITIADKPNFGPVHIRRMSMPLPEICVQREIGKVLRTYDELIENNLHRMQLLEEAARCRYKLLIDGFTEANPLSYFAAMIKRGISPKYVEAEGVTVINQKCIRDLSVNYFLARLTDPAKRIASERMLQQYDTLINSTGTGTLGRVSIHLHDDFPSTVDSHVTIVRAKNNVPPLYLSMAVLSQQDVISMMGEGSTNQTELSVKRLSAELKIPVVSQDEMLSYHEAVASQFDLIWNLQKQNVLLRQARDILLPRLMNGEIDIAQSNLEAEPQLESV